jgi:hypothetical protein
MHILTEVAMFAVCGVHRKSRPSLTPDLAVLEIDDASNGTASITCRRRSADAEKGKNGRTGLRDTN